MNFGKSTKRFPPIFVLGGTKVGASTDAPPASNPVPAVSEETKDQVSDSTDPYSSHASGEDASAPSSTEDQSVPEPEGAEGEAKEDPQSSSKQ